MLTPTQLRIALHDAGLGRIAVDLARLSVQATLLRASGMWAGKR
jgi:hypothetical protein